jgi:alcohol dehydrogenase class IV
MFLGSGCVKENASMLSEIGKHALIVTGAHSARVSGALEDVLAALQTAGCLWTLFDQVTANPTIDCAYAGAHMACAAGADFVLAIGGGSPMDAGKAIALLAKNPQLTPQTLFAGSYPGGALPIVCIPTTAGTGSEVTKASILTNDAAKTKSSIANELLFPKVAFLDGKYTEELPLRTTIHTAVDALSHAAEGMLSCKACVITDALAKESLGRIGACFSSLQKGSLSPQQRQSLLAASTEAGMVIANTGTTAVHAMGYSLTYFKHIDHGRANGLLFADFLEFVCKKSPQRVQQVLSALGCTSVAQLRGVLSALLGKPEPLSEKEAEQFAAIAIRSKNIENCLVKPTQQDLLHIYRAGFSL